MFFKKESSFLIIYIFTSILISGGDNLKKFRLYTILALCILLNTFILQAKDVYIGGESVGLVFHYDGVMITGNYQLKVDNKIFNPNTDLKKGDRIIEINDKKIRNIKEMNDILLTFREKENRIPIKIIRNNKNLYKEMITYFDDINNTFKSGLYVKEALFGIGTMSYYDPETKRFAALGHEVSESGNDISSLQNGYLYKSNVSSVTKSAKNLPGEKHAIIDFNNKIGKIDHNSIYGVYGDYDINLNGMQMIETLERDKVQTGKAYILTVLENNKIEKFEINITNLKKQSKKDIKGITFEVSDSRLLNKTSGIIQGMSGSPIIQDDKLIGSVTHVITSDPAMGYGIYIDFMLEEMQE